MRHRLAGRIVKSRRDFLVSVSGRSLFAVSLAGLATGIAQAQETLPVGGSVVSGTATVATSATTTTVTQTSHRAIVNWTSFDVGAGNAVAFQQPDAKSTTLNRVTGSTGSTIAGQITANGLVYLVNPNGIAITASGNVQTGGGFVASTLDIADSDFNAGKLNFAGTGASAKVSNTGKIGAGAGTYVALLGGVVSNAGTIIVPLGKVALGSGESVALDLNGDGFMRVAVPTSAIAGDNAALIEMAGSVAASAGRVELKAATVKDAVRNVINLTGSISADSATGSGGTIILLGSDGGTVHATGTLSAKATGATGDGGFVESSGATVDLTGLKVDASAAHGKAGTWLIDPTDLTVDAAAAATISANLATANVTLQTTSTAASGTGVQAAGNGDITIASAIGWTSANTLSLLAYNNIAINAAITGAAGGLTLTAGNGNANTGAVTATGAVNIGTFNLTNGTWTQVAATLPSFKANDFRFTVGNANFLRATGGTGATATPYLLADIYGLQGLASRSYLGNSFTLANDVDASGTATWNAGLGFNPIGMNASGQYFTGIFNGVGHVVTGLAINRTATNNVGLFGYNNGGTISNVGLIGGTVRGANNVGALIGYQENGTARDVYATTAVSGTTVVGGLVGQLVGTLTRAYATGTVTSTGQTNAYAGGLVGQAYASLDNVYATGAVSSAGMYTGGLVGVVTGTVSNTYATGSVTSTNQYAGGLVGYSGSTIATSYATGAVTGTTNVGGLVGSSVNAVGNITGAYWDTYSTGQAQASGTVTNQAGATAVTSDPGQATAANYAFKATAYANLTAASGLGTAAPSGFVFFSGGSTRPFLAFEVPVAGNPNIFTNASNQILLTNSHQLQLIGYNGTTLAASYALANAIDLTETGRVVVGTPASYAGMWAVTGWVPIGTDGAGLVWDGASFVAGGGTGFSGSLNGNGLVIDRLTISRAITGNPGSRIGLFGLTSTGTIGNLGLTNGTVTGRIFVGGLVGVQNSGTLSNVYSSINVTGTTLNDGGLVGSQNAGGVVTNAYATGTVTGTGSVGGLIGIARGTNSNVYATGNITANSSASGFGGLIGFMNGGTLTNGYATGNIGGGTAQSVGGLIGSASSGTIRYAYATGAVTGSDYVGGLIGTQSFGTTDNVYASGAVNVQGQDVGALIGNNTGTLTNGYWDSYTSQQVNAVGYNDPGSNIVSVTSDPSQSGAANFAFMASAYANLTAASGLGTATPTGFAVMTGGASTRPFLAFEVPVAGNPLTVINAAGQIVLGGTHQLQLVGYNATTLSGSYTLGGNLSLAETGANTGTAANSAGMWSTAGFVPIGTDGAGNVFNVNTATFDALGIKGFSGTLDGTGYTLSGLSVARAGFNDSGLFGWTTGTLRNLVLTGATVSGKTNVGALTGYLYLGTVNNVSIAGTTRGTANVGGVVGLQYKALVTGVTSSGTVGGTSNVGGVTGFEQSSQITNSTSSVNASATQAYAGGLVGYQLNGTANSNVAASGTVSAPNGAGGLVGLTSGFVNAAESSNTATITNASATGSVSGSSGTGGLIGFLGNNAAVSQSYATGTVNGATNTGGLIGYQWNSSVTDSYATGAITGTTNTGGLIGTVDGAAATITNTYATGAVTGTTATGGLVGSAINAASVLRSVWDTTTTGQATSAGGIGATGYTTAQLQDFTNYVNVFAGWDFTNIWLVPNQAGQNGTATAHYPRLRIRPAP